MAQEDIFLEKLWDIGNFAFAGVIDAAMNFAVLAEIFRWALDSNDGPIRFIIASVGGGCFLRLSDVQLLPFLSANDKQKRMGREANEK